ncbi:MAG: nucleotidyl transferase AbiEii/AbiGii toxin family protein [Gammaproteobacteria bacterium]|nr:nucleotidyl transferase AbiEii/AbiGii toxin family protein [Gammaproteobacteria bacterium]
MPADVYLAQVRLLVSVLPVVAKESCFALKGGTAINLFVRSMPRLSVDIDLAYVRLGERGTALAEIDEALRRVAGTLERTPFELRVRINKQDEGRAFGLFVSNAEATIKIEVSPVLRGSVYPERNLRIVEAAEAEFGFAEGPVVSFADLYAGKLVAALDRQHPRDLFDVKLLLAAEGIGDALFRAFIVYLVSHDGAIARLLNPTAKPLRDLYARQFAGMTTVPVTLEELDQARAELISAVRARLGEREKAFLMSFKRGKPVWELLGVAHAAQLPAIRWKLLNLERMADAQRNAAIARLEHELGRL